MEERIIEYRQEAKALNQISVVVIEAIKDLEKLGHSKEQAIYALAKIIGTRKECVSNFLNRPSLPRGSYRKTLKKLQEFASAYEETGGFK